MYLKVLLLQTWTIKFNFYYFNVDSDFGLKDKQCTWIIATVVAVFLCRRNWFVAFKIAPVSLYIIITPEYSEFFRTNIISTILPYVLLYSTEQKVTLRPWSHPYLHIWILTFSLCTTTPWLRPESQLADVIFSVFDNSRSVPFFI